DNFRGFETTLGAGGEQTQAIAGHFNDSRTAFGKKVPHRLVTGKGNHLVPRRQPREDLDDVSRPLPVEVDQDVVEEDRQRQTRLANVLDPRQPKGKVELLAGSPGQLLVPPFATVGLIYAKRTRLGRAGVNAHVAATGQFLECPRGEPENARLLLLF